VIDVHAHLCDPVFDADRPAVLDRARRAGVTRVLCVGETLADAERNLALAEAHQMLWAAAGLYPTILDLDQAERMIGFIRRHRDRLRAIGEVGLDRWKVQDEEGRALQEEIFRRFIRLSRELDLPLNIHSRSAGRRTLELLEEEGPCRALLHAFDGKAALAPRGLDLGCWFSIPPSVARSRQKQKLLARLPLERILLESDAPVLGPEPGGRNEPANLTVSLAAVAGAVGCTAEEADRVTTENALKLFGG
jgi:TatD DNase family protein